MYIHAHIEMYLCITQTYVHGDIYIYIYIHIHTRAHTHTHTHIQFLPYAKSPILEGWASCWIMNFGCQLSLVRQGVPGLILGKDDR